MLFKNDIELSIIFTTSNKYTLFEYKIKIGFILILQF